MELESLTRTDDFHFIDDPLSISPNPAMGSLTIELREHEKKDTEILILNAAGHKIQQFRMTGKKQTIDLGPIKVGLYLVFIFANGQTHIKKFIKM